MPDPTLSAEDLPEVCTAAEIAAFERVDARTIRAAFDAGELPGAYRRGRNIRVVRDTYLDAIGRRQPCPKT